MKGTYNDKEMYIGRVNNFEAALLYVCRYSLYIFIEVPDARAFIATVGTKIIGLNYRQI